MPSISPMHPEGISLPSAAQVQSISADDIGRTAIRLVILCMLVAMAGMSWTRNVNWDEFYFLSHVHANLDGRLDLPLQTVFVHAFGWLADVSGNEVDQIAIARLVMLGFFVASCLALHRIAVTLAGNDPRTSRCWALSPPGLPLRMAPAFVPIPWRRGS